MKWSLLIAAFAALIGTSAVAQTYENCTKVERGQFLAANERAKRLTLTATTAIGPNPTFQRWFGPYNAKSGEIVRRNLKAIVTALRTDKIHAVCSNDGQGLCDPDTFAFVDKDAAYNVHLCPSFFEMDTFKQLTTESVSAGNGTRAGTLIHEISHFKVVADTEDFCYSREDCTEMAESEPLDAILNADSYQYFVEDVTFFGVGGGRPE